MPATLFRRIHGKIPLMAQRGSRIPLDDDAIDIDLADLPTDEELEDAQISSGPAIPATSYQGTSDGQQEISPLGLLQLWVVLVTLFYFIVGWTVGLAMAFLGPAQLGFAVLSHPSFYLLVLFWPITIWQLFWNQF